MGVDGGQVAVYIRWSTEDQAAGTTLAVQHEACRHYVLSQGWRVRDDLCFVDDGWSGGNLLRPGLERLRRLVAAGEVGCVVVYKIDRLSRNLVDAVQLVLREWEGRCHLKSVREPIDTTTDLGRMIFGILAMFADFERTAIRDRTQSGKIQRIRGGEQMHARPAFGYAPDPAARGRWVELAAEAAVVRLMFAWAAAGVPAGAIVRRLNAAGLLTRSGREWSARSALWVLHNRTYIGEVVYGRTSLRVDADGHRVRVVNPAPRVAGPTGAAPALVEEAIFAQAEAEITAHRTRQTRSGSRAAGSPHLLTGLARCPCGSAMVYKAGARRGGGHYVCARTRRGTCNRRGHVPAEAAEALVAGCLIRRLGSGPLPADAIARALETVREERRALAAAMATLRREGTRAEAAAARAGEGLLREDGRRRAADVAGRLALMRRRLSELDACLAQAPADLAGMNAAEVWHTLPAARRRELLWLAVDGPIRVWRDPGGEVGMEVGWRC
ncbi:MAG TPA: recombinase family protein [Bacillota bacterium]|nr:recombinase family protein [Bacillota bacterium]